VSPKICYFALTFAADVAPYRGLTAPGVYRALRPLALFYQDLPRYWDFLASKCVSACSLASRCVSACSLRGGSPHARVNVTHLTPGLAHFKSRCSCITRSVFQIFLVFWQVFFHLSRHIDFSNWIVLRGDLFLSMHPTFSRTIHGRTVLIA